MSNRRRYLFVLSPPYCGSTVLWQLLKTSAHATALPKEGQFLEPVQGIMRDDPWNPNRSFPWARIKEEWDRHWDPDAPIALEKSPPNLLRAFEIEAAFIPSSFIAMIRDPYATIEGLVRKRGTPPMEEVVGWSRAATIQHAAHLWLRFAECHLRNVARLRHVLPITYESLTEQPALVAERIVQFLPALEKLDAGAPVRAHSILGKKRRPLANFNQLQIDRLSAGDLAVINDVLGTHRDLMEAVGYRYLYPSKATSMRRAASSIRLLPHRAEMALRSTPVARDMAKRLMRRGSH